MKTTKFEKYALLLVLSFSIATSFQSCEPEPEPEPDNDIVYKPNIYIYPNENIILDLKINFPKGGEIVKSIPDYVDGWKVEVDSTGLIDSSYRFLFYESTQPNVWQKQYGWNVKTDDLESFFRENMTEYGFHGKEIDDFVEYWIPRLNDYSSFLIYPQTSEIINEVIDLDFSKQPDNLLRLFYVINGANKDQGKLTQPEIISFKRKGYFVTEWGVILK